MHTDAKSYSEPLHKMEKDLLVQCELFELTLQQAGQSLDPSTLSMYLFQLAQSFNSFYAALSISNAETEEKKQLRLKISSLVSTILKSGMQLLGILVPEKM
jgi:arginyl-tRNA synthetase